LDTTRNAQIIASEKSLVEAMKTNNVALLDRLLHDELLFNGPNGETATKAQDLANYRSGNINLRTVDATNLKLSMIGDDAVVAVTVRIVGNYLGQDVNGSFRYLRVWKLFDAGWQVIGGSVVALPTPAPTH
jgi:hypothetical protein